MSDNKRSAFEAWRSHHASHVIGKTPYAWEVFQAGWSAGHAQALEEIGAGGVGDVAPVRAPQTAEAERAAWSPYLVDRADGVKGHYAIARWNPRGYQQVWNLRRHCWSSASDEVLCHEEADSLLRQISIPTAQALQARAALSSRPVQGVDVDALAQFIRSLKEWYSMSAGQLAERIAAWLSSAPAREQWQPIETAPAERGIYLVRIGDQTHIAQFDPRMSSAKWWHPYGLPARLERQPTHWMPLPAAPGATAEPVKVREPMSEEQLGDAATGIKPYPMGLVLVPSEQLIAFARAIERHHGICKE